MITNVVKYLVDQLVKKGLIEKMQQDEYLYSLTGLFEGMLTTGSILVLAIGFKKLIPTILFLFCFFSLRRRTGGFHLNRFGSCYIGTLFLYLMIVLCAKYIVQKPWLLIVLTSCSYILILHIGTVNHPNMDMNKKELKASKTSSRLLVSMLMMLVGFLDSVKIFSQIQFWPSGSR